MRSEIAKIVGSAAIALTLGVGALSVAPAPASADVAVSLGWSSGYGFRDRHWGTYEPRYSSYVHPRANRYWRGYRGGFYPTSVYRGNCRPIYRDYYRYGRMTRMGATQCYDRWGRPYIVRGSEFRIGRGHW